MTPPALSQMFGRLRGRPAQDPIMLPPDQEGVQVVGDIHGCDRLLAALMQRLDPDLPLVFVGDAIDRGPASRAVLNRLRILDARPNVTCLMGNHEKMLLSFLDDPLRNGSRWLEYGGLATLHSYEVEGVGDVDLRELRSRLETAMGPDLVGWIRKRPAFVRFGTLVVVHAGLDPEARPEDQPVRNMIWGHPKFATRRRADDLWVAHGHTVVERPFARDGRIALDTGAWQTGRLTAGRITRDGVDFLMTRPT